MFIDVHAHLDDKAFHKDREEVLQRIKEAGIIVVNAGADIKSSYFSVELAEKYDFIYACVGVHPHDAAKVPKDYLRELEELAKHPKVIAIGEIAWIITMSFLTERYSKRFFWSSWNWQRV